MTDDDKQWCSTLSCVYLLSNLSQKSLELATNYAVATCKMMREAQGTCVHVCVSVHSRVYTYVHECL